MGAQERTIGGNGGTKRLGANLVNWLNSGLTAGQFGANFGQGSNQGLSGIINQFLTTDFNDPTSSAMSALAARTKASNIADLRSRYTLSGNGYGTPAAVGESNYSSGFDANLISQLGQQKLTAAMNLLGLISNIGSKGLTQAQTVMTPGPLSDFLGVLGAGTDVAKLFSGAFGGSKIPPAPKLPEEVTRGVNF